MSLETWAEVPPVSVWRTAGLVLVGADMAGALAGEGATEAIGDRTQGSLDTWAGRRAGWPRRSGVVLVGSDPSVEADPAFWRAGVCLGAEHVAVLPAAEHWLIQRFAGVAEPGVTARQVSITGGCGGAGASVLAVSVAVSAALRGRRALLVDADLHGAGPDALLGSGHLTGLRWGELAQSRGRLSSLLLREALPRVDGLSLLSWGAARADGWPDASGRPGRGVVEALVEAAARGFDVVVTDAGRGSLDFAAPWVSAADLALLVVPERASAAGSAAATRTELARSAPDVRVVVRRLGGPSPGARAVADDVGAPLLDSLRSDRRLDAAIDRGEPPGVRRRRPHGRLADRILDELGRLPGAA